MDRDDTAKVLGLAPEKVRILPTATGGGFGSKIDVSLQPLIGLVALKTGRPAALAYTRNESMMSTTKRHPAEMTATIGADADGMISGMVFDGDFNTGAYASFGPTVANRVPVHASGPYVTPNYRATGRAIHTNGPVSGRLSRLRRAAGDDLPRNALRRAGRKDRHRPAGIPLEERASERLRNGHRAAPRKAVGIVDCLEALKPHWSRALADAEAFNAGHVGRKRGVGVASCWYGCGNTSLPNPSTIKLGLSAVRRSDPASGRGRYRPGLQHGHHADLRRRARPAARKIPAEKRRYGDHAGCRKDLGVAPDLRHRQGRREGQPGLARKLSCASPMSRRRPSIALDGASLTIREGEAVRRIDLATLKPDAEGFVFRAEESYDPPTLPLDAKGQGKPYAVYGYGAQIAELEVDLKLGTVRLIKITAAHDVGKAINPLLAEGQIEGGIAQGIGMALMEEYVPGRTENLHDYLIPTIGDVPEIESILIEVPDPEGPFGAKGLGEHVLIPTAPAILNAIRHATGVLVTKVPATPSRIRAAIREAEAQT